MHIVKWCPDLQSSIFYIYKNRWAYRCLFVCLLVCGGLMEIQTNLDEILHKHPHLSKEGFGLGLTPAPSSPGPHELENLRKLTVRWFFLVQKSPFYLVSIRIGSQPSNWTWKQRLILYFPILEPYSYLSICQS